MKKIQVEGTPIPKGHYSQAIVHNGLVYVSGQLPMDPVKWEPVAGGIEKQTEQALKNVEAILHAAGSDLTQVIQMTIYISDGDYWAQVNEVYARVMGDHRPARAIVPVKDLHFGLGIEIQAIAAVPGSGE
nr:putative endoribonuclease L-PSP [uncultured bacterium]AIA14924.1 putative endoribonuclease L-PSP [uncultured bacterium]